ncbi:hypothetical protein FOZ63_017846, partial [Perkinsus olseni]
NSCSRLLDAVARDEVPFSSKVTPFVKALKAFHAVKERCFGLHRLPGWERSIEEFGVAWDETGLSPTLKVHIVLHHVQEYLSRYESVADAGLSLSSEQSGEALHARLQRVWNLRFKVNPDNSLFPDRLVDCMVSYNWNLQWDEAGRKRIEPDSSRTAESGRCSFDAEGRGISSESSGASDLDESSESGTES